MIPSHWRRSTARIASAVTSSAAASSGENVASSAPAASAETIRKISVTCPVTALPAERSRPSPMPGSTARAARSWKAALSSTSSPARPAAMVRTRARSVPSIRFAACALTVSSSSQPICPASSSTATSSTGLSGGAPAVRSETSTPTAYAIAAGTTARTSWSRTSSTATPPPAAGSRRSRRRRSRITKHPRAWTSIDLCMTV